MPLLLVLVHQVHVLVGGVQAVDAHTRRHVPCGAHGGGAAAGPMGNGQAAHVVQPWVEKDTGVRKEAHHGWGLAGTVRHRGAMDRDAAMGGGGG